MIMIEFKITFFRLVAGLRCPVVLGPRSSCVPVLSFWRAEYLRATRSYIVSYHIVYRDIYVIGHLLVRYQAEGGGSSSWTVQKSPPLKSQRDFNVRKREIRDEARISRRI
jgi:hypothetical protein